MNTNPEFATLFDLPVAERLQLVEDLRDSIAAETHALSPSEALLAELRARKAAFDANTSAGIRWDEVQRRLREG